MAGDEQNGATAQPASNSDNANPKPDLSSNNAAVIQRVNGAAMEAIGQDASTSDKEAHTVNGAAAEAGTDQQHAEDNAVAETSAEHTEAAPTNAAAEGAASGSSDGATLEKPATELYPMSKWKYDAFLWSMSVFVDLFFREVHPRGSWRVPKKGPVLFVAAPHANQFVDALILQRTLRHEARRRVSLLVASKSVHGFIGWASRQTGAVPVGRAQDAAKPKPGTVYLPEPVDDPTLIRGIGTDFTKDAEVGGMLFLPAAKGQSSTSTDIAEIISATELRIKRPCQDRLPITQLTGREDVDDKGNFTNTSNKSSKEGYEGTKYKLAPHIDQTKVYEAVFSRLRSGGCVGIFPEGGSHDRTGLLPLKAGVAIMALGASAEDPNLNLKIVPVGMNYFHAHKFRSRAVVEFGQAIDLKPELVQQYTSGNRRAAIGQVLDTVYQSLAAVTVQTPDYDTLMLIQAARRLYKPAKKKFPLPIVVELNRRLAMGYEKYKDDERIMSLSTAVKEYNAQLRYLNIRDHQVEYARMSYPKVIITAIFRILKLLVLLVGTLPGVILFAPVFIAAKVMSIKKAKEALAGSTVKVQGRDVMATWKIMTAMVFAPALYNIYIVIFVYRVYTDRLWGYWDYVPQSFPLWFAFPVGWVLFPAITFASLRTGEVGMDIFKSLRPLMMCINPSSSYNIQKLRVRRVELSERVTDVINELGPEMFPDFDKIRIVSEQASREDSAAYAMSPPRTPGRPQSSSGQKTPTGRTGHRRFDSDMSSTTSATDLHHIGPESPGSRLGQAGSSSSVVRRDTTSSSRNLPRHDSFSNIGQVGLFSTRPPSRSRSRSSSAGGGPGFFGASMPVSAMTSLDSKAGLDEVSKKIRAEMKERGELRRRQTLESEKAELGSYRGSESD